MRLSDIPRDNIPAALAYADQVLDKGTPISGDDYSALQQLQRSPAAFREALDLHVRERRRAGKPVPGGA